MSSDTSESTGEHSDGGYVHRPDEAGGGDAADSEAYTGKSEGDGFGKQGWILVAGVITCFLVIPGVIYLYPTAPAQLGWTFFATFLALPLVPAVLLGLLAVWSMQAAA